MQYDLVIKRTLREAQDILWANLPPASNLPESDGDQPNTTINRLWDVLDQPELNSALRQNSCMTLWQKKPPAR